jgi:hypothetical protein
MNATIHWRSPKPNALARHGDRARAVAEIEEFIAVTAIAPSRRGSRFRST